MYTTQAHTHTCPYCDHVTPDAGTRREANVRLADHIRSFHRERVTAWHEYQRVLSVGSPVEEARASYNQTLAALWAGPGTYQRRPR